jgi:mRNA-degrading endonuclease RelE of RelBE toxin-antitoxin system
MEFRIRMTEDAEQQFRALPSRDQRALQTAILARLRHQPMTLTRAVKRLRSNPVAEYELRAGDLRVLYDVEAREVIISVVGRNVGNKLIVAGEEFRGHQDDPVESPGGGSDGRAD